MQRSVRGNGWVGWDFARACGETGRLRQLLLLLFAILCGTAGCSDRRQAEDAVSAEVLHRQFPAHAARVLRGHDAFVAAGDGFAARVEGRSDTTALPRGGLSAKLPSRAKEPIRFAMPDGVSPRTT